MNERLTFTHGYGLTLGPVNQVTSEGRSSSCAPPQSTVDLKIDEPSIYFGELTNDYVIVRTETREFHYPRGDDNEFTQYQGTGGVALGSLWRKLIFALRFGSYQILSDDIGPESRILFNRKHPRPHLDAGAVPALPRSGSVSGRRRWTTLLAI